MTPLGQMTVVLATQEEYIDCFPGVVPLESLMVCITSGPVCDYLTVLGWRRIYFSREAREDSIPSVTALPNKANQTGSS
jgi:hypothetical protein